MSCISEFVHIYKFIFQALDLLSAETFNANKGKEGCLDHFTMENYKVQFHIYLNTINDININEVFY